MNFKREHTLPEHLQDAEGLPRNRDERLLWIRRKVEEGLELRHEVHLAAAVQDVDPLLGGGDGIAVEVGGALLELGEVLDAAQRPLGSEEPLYIHSP